MDEGVTAAIEPLIKRGIFATEEEAIRALVRRHVLSQIAALKRDITRFERKYGMSFERFEEYLHSRSRLLENGNLPAERRQALNRAIMTEEDDWLDWKAAQEMIESWLGLRREIPT